MSGFNVQLQLAGVLEWMSQQMAGRRQDRRHRHLRRQGQLHRGGHGGGGMAGTTSMVC
ncbi:MAG: hypothetical protein ACLUIX_01275 [Oscillospiraceae bacterium]